MEENVSVVISENHRKSECTSLSDHFEMSSQ